ncbi:hypothetical protein FNV43_RR22303 [Rhamnella rubrinervis]|uniref:Ribulose-phosphate 3-epimerase n=1 Tax=Rhamnella rubrinervis TaxID=2594499 RepID=A0A8K0DRA8_9ROSA|nr:hypothetical protein FNV43_RR22303 [Rhamnella rubrinervis]
MGVKAKIAPSMLSSDFANLASEAHRMVEFGADWLHMDIMVRPLSSKIRCRNCSFNFTLQFGWVGFLLCSCSNFYGFAFSCVGLGNTDDSVLLAQYELIKLSVFIFDGLLAVHFVPNLTIGAPVIESLRKHTKAYLDCHLMVTNPLDYVEPLGKAGASGFTFHVEVSKENWQELVQRIKSKGMKPGVAVKPGTPVEEVYPLIDSENPVEMVLVMTVEPGFGGQKFMPNTMDKVRTLRKKYPELDIEVDGGLGPSTIEMAASAGANCIVAGSSVFGAAEPAQVISLLRNSVEEAQRNS